MLRAKGLMQQGAFAQALAVLGPLLGEAAENRDLLYCTAVCERYLGQPRAALATLARCEACHPSYSRLFQERGHCHRALTDVAAALDAYRRALALNPHLPASWQALSQLAEPAEARAARDRAAGLSAQPPALVAAASLLADGDVHEAEQQLHAFLGGAPDHPEGLRLLARSAAARDSPAEAQALLEQVLLRAPAYHEARYEYALLLWRRHRHAQALHEVEQLLAIEPGHVAFLTLKANVLGPLGRHEEALALFEQLRERSPGQAELALSIAHVLRTLGRQREAIEHYRAATLAREGYGEAYWSLANLKTYRFTDGEVAAMQAAVRSPQGAPADRWHLHFALGKALEDRGDYEASFEAYARGNALKRAEGRYDGRAITLACARQARVCTPEFFAARHGFGCPSDEPIFIVGLPRAGSTLLEQILASHSQVEGTRELPEIPHLAARLDGPRGPGTRSRYPEVLAELSAAGTRALGEEYLAQTRAYRSGRRYFIDKMPNNFRHVGLIHLILPNARIIDARREAMACCFGNFKQLFAAGQEFTYDLADLGHYYRDYLALMAHWDRALPGKVLQVQHEELVADLEGSVRRMLRFLGLPFEPACLEFHRSARSVRTASSEQVRRPISREGLAAWRPYERWLAPLAQALGSVADAAAPIG
ncbi:MAG: sulfotransferase [Proteobacteria bacterium]|nr:sulfotransferase [Pseudomonadota bacterium]